MMLSEETRDICAKVFLDHLDGLTIYFASNNVVNIGDNVDILMIGFARALNDSGTVTEFLTKVFDYIREELANI